MFSKLEYRVRQNLAKEDPINFTQELKANEKARRQFWEYIFDVDNFREWNPQSRSALINEAYVDGLATLYKDSRAVTLTLAVSLAVTVLPAVPIALLLGSAACLLPPLAIGMALFAGILAVSFTANYLGVSNDNIEPSPSNPSFKA